MKDIEQLLENWNEMEAELNRKMELNQQLVKKMMWEKPHAIWGRVLNFYSRQKTGNWIVIIGLIIAALLNNKSPGMFFYFMTCAVTIIPYYFLKKTELEQAKKVNLGNDSVKDSIIKLTKVYEASRSHLYKMFFMPLILPVLMICYLAMKHHIGWDSFWKFNWISEHHRSLFSIEALIIPLALMVGGAIGFYIEKKQVLNRLALLKSNLKELEELETTSF